MDVVEVLERNGGCARFRELRAAGLTDAVTTARSHGGIVSHTSAAVLHGLKVVNQPSTVHVTVPRGRHRRSTLACTLHWADEIPAVGDVTTVARTVLDCARTLPFSEALTIADSALRSTDLVRDDLEASAAALRGPNCLQARRVAQLADARAESPLESTLRAILIEAGITGFVPQVEVRDKTFSARIDLAHPGLSIAIEADSFEFHGTRKALQRDCRRHVNLTIRGWRLLRFSWEDVMYDSEWVVEAVRAAVAGAAGHRNLIATAA